MITSNIVPVKYVFLDVVGYSKHTVEAQCYIIRTLNRIVKGAVNRFHISDNSVIFVPTGDGVCICLLGVTLPYDIHVTIAKEILRRCKVSNDRVKENWKRFEVRIGINQSDDNVVTDINGYRNVTGAGINNARRIMDLADGSQILVSGSVYDNLYPRKQYRTAFGGELTATVKHGLVLKMRQLILSNAQGLNINKPSSFVTQTVQEPELPLLTAFYFAHCIKNEKEILSIATGNTYQNNWLKLLLWFLSKDSEAAFNSTPDNVYNRKVMPDTGATTFSGHLAWFHAEVPGEVAIDLSYVVVNDAIPWEFRGYLAHMSDNLVVTPDGKDKLRKEYPQIWAEFKLT